MLFTFYHMVLFQVITRGRIPPSHQEKLGGSAGPTWPLLVARETLVTRVRTLGLRECSAGLPGARRDFLVWKSLHSDAFISKAAIPAPGQRGSVVGRLPINWEVTIGCRVRS